MSYKIGEVAEMVGMTVEGLRYYNRRGLVRPARRTPSGYRLYGDRQLDRLRFVKASQEMGFSLEEIDELLEIRDGSDETCTAVQRRLEDKLDQVRRRLELLQAMEADLSLALERCEAQIAAGGGDDCPVLHGLGESAVASPSTTTEGEG